ncbi:MAG: 50S ribosomal protein L22 [Clostridia bacterium]|nr:50S ribosomal protein L22 [Clostridia bacterium]
MAKRIREKTAKLHANADNRPKASAKYVRISSSKVCIVLDTIRGRSYDEAVGILNAIPNKASDIVLKIVNSAAANAENNKGLNKHDLFVAEATATQGPTLKRSMAAGKGSANRILKRTSHINIVLDVKE